MCELCAVIYRSERYTQNIFLVILVLKRWSQLRLHSDTITDRHLINILSIRYKKLIKMYNMADITTELYSYSTLGAELQANMSHVLNATSTCPNPNPSKTFGLVVKVVYAIGIIGNAVAIVALRRGERRVRNRKHLLMLTSLAGNDIVALVGMLCSMVVAEQWSWTSHTRAYCAARVVLRVFGIGSVCIAVTMALERYLALTRPFLYQKQVTYYMIRMTLFVSWFFAAVLTCVPVMGVGLYYNPETQCCVRYRNATSGLDFAYAVIYVIFGTLLCVVLVYCNLAVIRAMYAFSAPRNGGPPVVRRVSKSSCRQRNNTSNSYPQYNAATAEEVAFSRLMAMLSGLFMLCWLPQMMTSALYLSVGEKRLPILKIFTKLSDVLMLLNYVLDPILYVLMRQKRHISSAALCHSITHCFKRNHKTSTESMKTSCCPQETVIISESSGAELRPLRPPVCAAIVKIDD